jgi:hypothetical protein
VARLVLAAVAAGAALAARPPVAGLAAILAPMGAAALAAIAARAPVSTGSAVVA